MISGSDGGAGEHCRMLTVILDHLPKLTVDCSAYLYSNGQLSWLWDFYFDIFMTFIYTLCCIIFTLLISFVHMCNTLPWKLVLRNRYIMVSLISYSSIAHFVSYELITIDLIFAMWVTHFKQLPILNKFSYIHKTTIKVQRKHLMTKTSTYKY